MIGSVESLPLGGLLGVFGTFGMLEPGGFVPFPLGDFSVLQDASTPQRAVTIRKMQTIRFIIL